MVYNSLRAIQMAILVVLSRQTWSTCLFEHISDLGVQLGRLKAKASSSVMSWDLTEFDFFLPNQHHKNT